MKITSAYAGQKATEKEAHDSSLGGGRFNKQGIIHDLFLGNHKSRFPHPPVRDLNVDIKAITGPSVSYHPEGLNHIALTWLHL